jgi:FlaA1/EpsC-like NDP-sugar epimerase
VGASVALRGADPAAIGVRPPHAPVAAPEWRPAARVLAPIAFTLADVAAIGTAAALTYALRTAIWGPFPFHLSFWTAAAIWLVFRVFARLMPPYAMAPASELRRSTMTTLGAALTHAALLTAADQHTAWRYFGLLAWLLAIPLSWFTRAGVRILLIRRRLYGFPVVVIGTGIKACRAIREMRAARDVGFVPVAAYGEDPEKWGTEIEGVPVLGPVSAADAGPLGTQDAMIALSRSEANGAELLAITRSLAPRFPRLQVLSDLNGTANLWVFPRAVGAYLALETRHARFTPTSRAIKRCP